MTTIPKSQACKLSKRGIEREGLTQPRLWQPISSHNLASWARGLTKMRLWHPLSSDKPANRVGQVDKAEVMATVLES